MYNTIYYKCYRLVLFKIITHMHTYIHAPAYTQKEKKTGRERVEKERRRERGRREEFISKTLGINIAKIL